MEGTFFDQHLSVFIRKSRDEFSVPLERGSYHHWSECNAVIRGFSHCKGNLIAHYWCSIFLQMRLFCLSVFFSLCVACVDGLPMQIGKQGGGMDLLVYFKIANIVYIKTRHLVPPVRKAQ
jgi:hypothetical protein